MNIAVPSRFSCLNIEDEDRKPSTNKPAKKKDKKSNGLSASNNNNNSNGQSKKAKQQVHSNGQVKKKGGKPKQETKQWEEWKRKDSELVNDNFEQDLQSALMQSQLEYEKQLKHPAVLNISETNKKKKNKTMSLDEFLDEAPTNGNKVEAEKAQPKDFFETVLESGKKEIIKEQVKAKRKEREGDIDERITMAKIQEKYEKEKSKNEELRRELQEARKEIATVKKRNATLCNMLSQGEMKDKAAVLLELEKVTHVKDILTEEVAKLHELLEQERSKCGGAGDAHNKNKDKNKK